MTRKTRREAFICPNCGADVPADALACPECGADDQTGWSEDTAYDDLDLPLRAGDEPSRLSAQKQRFWRGVAIVVILAILVLVLLGWW